MYLILRFAILCSIKQPSQLTDKGWSLILTSVALMSLLPSVFSWTRNRVSIHHLVFPWARPDGQNVRPPLRDRPFVPLHLSSLFLDELHLLTLSVLLCILVFDPKSQYSAAFVSSWPFPFGLNGKCHRIKSNGDWSKTSVVGTGRFIIWGRNSQENLAAEKTNQPQNNPRKSCSCLRSVRLWQCVWARHLKRRLLTRSEWWLILHFWLQF